MHPTLKPAYWAGVADAQAMLAILGPSGSPKALDPTAMPGAGGPGEPASLEEIAAMMALLVESGKIDAITAEQVIETIVSAPDDARKAKAAGGKRAKASPKKFDVAAVLKKAAALLDDRAAKDGRASGISKSNP